VRGAGGAITAEACIFIGVPVICSVFCADSIAGTEFYQQKQRMLFTSSSRPC
jgi:hypothetical protein